MSNSILNREILATCWTWAGDAAPARGDEISPHDMAQRLRAVSAAGWKGIGINVSDVVVARDTIGLDALRRLIDDAGIEKVELEFITNWWATGDQRTSSDRIRHDLFEAAAVLGTTDVKVGAELRSFGATGGVTREAFAEAFDQLADDARSHDLRVAVEAMPMSNLRTIGEAADLVREVGNSHGGLIVDTWHVARGGTAFEDLQSILPMEHVFIVELDDADAEVVGSLWNDTINNRRLPGDGVLQPERFVAAMWEAGWRGYWGVEIISDEHRARSLEDGVSAAAEKTRATLDAAEKLLQR